MKEKTIITDIDGVCLYWNTIFAEYMVAKGYTDAPDETEYSLSKRYGISHEHTMEIVNEFNNSDTMFYLPGYRDSVKYVQKLHNEGFKFIAVTSISDVPETKIKRLSNLNDVFGDGIFTFDDLHCLPISGDKNEALSQWKDSGLFWIEDYYPNAVAGADQGLVSLLINKTYNQRDLDDIRIRRVCHLNPWREIYDIIKTEYKD